MNSLTLTDVKIIRRRIVDAKAKERYIRAYDLLLDIEKYITRQSDIEPSNPWAIFDILPKVMIDG